MKINRFRSYLVAGFVVIVLALMVAPVLGAMSDPVTGQDLSGTNMPGIDHWNTFVSSAQECSDLCDKTTGCLGAVYVPPNTGQGSRGHCWRKSVVTGYAPNPDLTSFTKLPVITCALSNPQADFSAHIQGGDEEGFAPLNEFTPLVIQFTDQSTGAQTWSWDFGDGSSPSSDRNPTHTYSKPKEINPVSYDVTLTVTGACTGETDTKKVPNQIWVYDNVGLGHLQISSNPGGAMIIIDGIVQNWTDTTPHNTPVPLIPGSHTLRLTLNGYKDFLTFIEIQNGKETYLSPVLEKISSPSQTTGRIHVTTIPEGVAIYVDGVLQGTSPKTVLGLAAGSHMVNLIKDGYIDYQTPVTVEGEQTTPLTITLVSSIAPTSTTTTSTTGTGFISIISSPVGASVNLDGWDKGTTPVTIPQVKAGSHTLTLTKTGYQDSITTVTVVSGQTAQVMASLTIQDPGPQLLGPGTLTIRSTPVGANVYIDGETAGITPVKIQNVKAGTRKILLTLQSYPDKTQTVEITAGSDKEVSIDLGTKKAPWFALPVSLAALAFTAVVVLGRKKGR